MMINLYTIFLWDHPLRVKLEFMPGLHELRPQSFNEVMTWGEIGWLTVDFVKV